MGHSPAGRLTCLAVASCLAVAAWQPAARAGADASATLEAAATAKGKGLKTAVLPLRIAGEVSEADRAALTGELVEGLRRGNFEVIAPEALQSAAGDLGECEQAKCIQKIGKKTAASHVVRTRVTVEDRDYQVEVELLDASTGAIVARTTEGCEICGIVDAGAIVSTSAATLRTKLDALAKGPSTLSVVSDPAGAEVRIDGEVAGVTPLDQQVVAGKRVLRISKEGYIALEREVTFVEGVQESLSFELEKVPSRLPSRPWGWVSLSVGIGSVAAAIAFAAIRDREYDIGDACKGSNVDEDGNCRRLWNTEYHVLGFALAGAALTTLGVAILLNTRGRKAKRAKPASTKPSAQLGVGPGNVALQGRF